MKFLTSVLWQWAWAWHGLHESMLPYSDLNRLDFVWRTSGQIWIFDLCIIDVGGCSVVGMNHPGVLQDLLPYRKSHWRWKKQMQRKVRKEMRNRKSRDTQVLLVPKVPTSSTHRFPGMSSISSLSCLILLVSCDTREAINIPMMFHDLSWYYVAWCIMQDTTQPCMFTKATSFDSIEALRSEGVQHSCTQWNMWKL